MLRSNISILLDELLLNFNSSTRILLHRNVEAATQFHCVSVTGFCAGGQPPLLFSGQVPAGREEIFQTLDHGTSGRRRNKLGIVTNLVRGSHCDPHPAFLRVNLTSKHIHFTKIISYGQRDCLQSSTQVCANLCVLFRILSINGSLGENYMKKDIPKKDPSVGSTNQVIFIENQKKKHEEPLKGFLYLTQPYDKDIK